MTSSRPERRRDHEPEAEQGARAVTYQRRWCQPCNRTREQHRIVSGYHRQPSPPSGRVHMQPYYKGGRASDDRSAGKQRMAKRQSEDALNVRNGLQWIWLRESPSCGEGSKGQGNDRHWRS